MPGPVEAHRDSDRLDPLIWKISSIAVPGFFLSQLDATVVNVSLSSLAVTFHGSLSAIQQPASATRYPSEPYGGRGVKLTN